MSLNDKLEEKYQPGSSVYTYCRSKLQSLVTELRLRKERNRFHFYFGDSLELCLTNEELHNKMHVIHCSVGFVRFAYLSNILSSVTCCLSTDMKEAVLVTEMVQHRLENKICPLINSIQCDLCCPLTMVPTVYGMKLLDHVRFGSSVCCTLHDNFVSAVHLTLKWNKTPVAYSPNMQLKFSPALKKVISDLAETCFTRDTTWLRRCDSNSLCKLFIGSRDFHRNSPLTFYNIVHSFFNRHNWVVGATESLIEQCLPVYYQLAWRTQRDWMEGKEVLLFYNDSSEFQEAILSVNNFYESTRVNLILKPIASKSHHRPGHIVSEDFFSNAHFVFKLNWKDSTDFVVSFLLTKDHGLGSTALLFVTNKDNNKILYFSELTSLSIQQKEVIKTQSCRFLPICNIANSLYDLRCKETEEEYRLSVGISLKNPKSILPIFYFFIYES